MIKFFNYLYEKKQYYFPVKKNLKIFLSSVGNSIKTIILTRTWTPIMTKSAQMNIIKR